MSKAPLTEDELDRDSERYAIGGDFSGMSRKDLLAMAYRDGYRTALGDHVLPSRIKIAPALRGDDK